jgi:hypothetical protein
MDHHFEKARRGIMPITKRSYGEEAQFDNDCESQSVIQAKNKIGSGPSADSAQR